MKRSRRGGNAVEFALLLPALLALLTGIVDYGWSYALRFAADSAAREGARVGALTPQDEDPDGAALIAAASRWTSLGLPAVPTVVSFREGAPEAMVVRVRVDTAALVGFVMGPEDFEVTVLQRMEEQP